MSGTLFTLEIQPKIPDRLSRLTELANDLYYSWDRHTRGLFYYLDNQLWGECRHNPKVFLRRVSQKRLEQASEDRAFLGEYQRTLANYDTYKEEVKRLNKVDELDSNTDLIAYFSAEFGLHESLPIYSGGLGILAGDHCKAASDLGIPFIAVGLLYRQGNLTQTIDGHGNQVSHYHPVNLEDLAILPAQDEKGEDLYVSLDLAKSVVKIKVWVVKAGHIRIYLLDTDVADNTEIDKAITYQIYPSDPVQRLKQEIILGIGGVRALTRLGMNPSVWHINEGHPSLQILERCRVLVSQGLEFKYALEMVASSSVFTTHTPVPAGHEVYDTEMFAEQLITYIDDLGIKQEEFFALGQSNGSDGFNLTTFSIRGSRFHNGVSRIHGGVASEMEQRLWPEIPVDENPMTYVTNGVHVQTFLANDWINLFDDPRWHNELLNHDYWNRIDLTSDATYWSVHLSLKINLYNVCRNSITKRCKRNGYSESQIENEIAPFNKENDALILGFARRFATYKRATLLFDDLERLEGLLNNPDKPVILLFAGKAHPHDEPGKDLIRYIHELSRDARFHGKVFLLEGYDLALARSLVAGVDVWVNTPDHPMEACGTSGIKAAVNGVLNLSVLDGWWDEGCNDKNGWGVQPHTTETDHVRRRSLENKELIDVLEQDIIPIYFDKAQGYSEKWVKMSKESMKTIIPQFNSQRMVKDYIEKLYLPAINGSRTLQENNYSVAKELTEWKSTINEKWSDISIVNIGERPDAIAQGHELSLYVSASLNGLNSNDIHVECLCGRLSETNDFEILSCHLLEAHEEKDGEVIYKITFTPDVSGLIAYKLRAYPYHKSLSHPFEMGYMKWL